MKEFVATFFSHYAATRFAKKMSRHNLAFSLRPVPRSLSSSCGTCVVFEAEEPLMEGDVEEVEAIYEKVDGHYLERWRN
ncbi:MAG: DUF3343 domain-containing protein [Sphaerochaetaceae bacterium]|jgi:hypothetical protein